MVIISRIGCMKVIKLGILLLFLIFSIRMIVGFSIVNRVSVMKNIMCFL